MIRMKSFGIIACMLALATGMAFGQGASFYFQWTNDLPSSNWYELTYCDTPPEWDVVLQDGTPVRIMKDRDNSGIGGVSYTPADTVCTIGHLGSLGEIWPTNEFVFNSIDISRPEGSFLSPTIQCINGVPSFQLVYLLVGCYVDDDFIPMWASCDFSISSGNTQLLIECPNGGAFGRPCWTRIGCCDIPPPCDPPPPVNGFIASDDNCDVIILTWEDYDSTAIAILGFPGVDSLLIKCGSTILTSVHWSNTAFVVNNLQEETFYTFSIKAIRRCGSTFSYSDPVEDTGFRPRYPVLAPTIQSVSYIYCDSVVCIYDMPINTLGWEQTVLLRNGTVVTSAPAGESSETDVRIVHYDAPRGQAYYNVAGFNSSCGIGPQSAIMIGEAYNAPEQVQNVNATDNDCANPSYVRVQWLDLNHDETGYKVYRDGARIATVGANTTQYNDASGIRGVTYAYTVTAYNDCGEGLPSLPNNGTLPRLPVAPTNVEASDSLCNGIMVTWIDQSDNETGFAIIRMFPYPTDTFYVSTGNQSYLDITAVPQIVYTYTVQSANACGFGGVGNTDTGMSRAFSPVSNLHEGESNCYYAQIRWYDNTSDEFGFLISRDGFTIDTTDPNHTSYTDIIATPGVEHFYRVAPFNDDCGVAESPDSAIATRLPPPNTPQNVLATDSACGSICCTWDVVLNADGYIVYRENVEREVTMFPIEENSTVFIDYTAVTGTIYNYWVSATNICGYESSFSNIDQGSSLVPVAQQPNIVLNVAGCDSIQFCWNETTNVDSFLIFIDGVWQYTIYNPDTCFAHVPLDYLMHEFWIEPYNSCGVGATSDTFQLALKGAASPPYNIWVSDSSCSLVYIRWDAPDGNFDEYVVYRDSVEISRIAPDSTEYLDYEAVPNDSFVYQISCFDSICGETALSVSAFGIRYETPYSPDSLITSDNGCDEIHLAWTPSIGVHDWYIVYRDSVIVDTLPAVDTSYVDTNVISNISYDYDLAALSDICGLSELYGATEWSIILSDPPAAPEITVTIDGPDAVVQWEPVTENISGCPIQSAGYIISFSEESDGPFWYLTYTTDTNYVHTDAVIWVESMFYRVDTHVGPARMITDINQEASRSRISLKQVLERLRR